MDGARARARAGLRAGRPQRSGIAKEIGPSKKAGFNLSTENTSVLSPS